MCPLNVCAVCVYFPQTAKYTDFIDAGGMYALTMFVERACVLYTYASSFTDLRTCQKLQFLLFVGHAAQTIHMAKHCDRNRDDQANILVAMSARVFCFFFSWGQ